MRYLFYEFNWLLADTVVGYFWGVFGLYYRIGIFRFYTVAISSRANTYVSTYIPSYYSVKRIKLSGLRLDSFRSFRQSFSFVLPRSVGTQLKKSICLCLPFRFITWLSRITNEFYSLTKRNTKDKKGETRKRTEREKNKRLRGVNIV